MDINDPIFGRWAREDDHIRWHNHTNPKFNDFWEMWIDELGIKIPTKQQVLDKLAEARNIYTINP